MDTLGGRDFPGRVRSHATRKTTFNAAPKVCLRSSLFTGGVMDVHNSAERPNEQDRELRREQTIKLPSDAAQLGEANLPRDLATALAGKEQPVALLWEKAPHIRRAEPWDTEYLIDPEGKCWSEHYPLQVFFRDDCGKV